MELKSLFLGIFFSIGIFAVKNGMGLHYILDRKRSLKSNIALFSLYGFVYFLIFKVSAHILQQIDILKYFDIVQGFLKTGMFIHILMAGLMFLWGVTLLKRGVDSKRGSYGWLALVVPCPVCMTVIVFSVGFLMAYFPDTGDIAVLSAYAGFIVISLITMVLMRFWTILFGSTPESILGSAMLIIAVYFLLSVIVMPQFGDLDKIYRLAMYKGEKQMLNITHLFSLYAVIVISFIIGFAFMRRKIRHVFLTEHTKTQSFK